jgi:phosphoglycolate phosphatase-like HAD superfamily hydrolase
MQLAIFDIDGTLTNTSAVDNHCFNQAVDEVFDFGDTTAHWHDCPHVTDSGLMHHIFQRQLRRAPLNDEIERMRACFISLMAAAVADDASLALPIAGAAAAFARLSSEPNWAVAIATGCWQASAHFKLAQAAIPFQQTPLAHADNFLSREDILTDALAQAETHYQTRFEHVVYIGDALWDVKTTRNLRMPFVGIAQGARAAQLIAAGARDVLCDYQDYERFLSALQRAAIPRF